MAQISDDLALIRRVQKKFGTPKLASEAGLAYTTVVDAKRRGFNFKALDTIKKLTDAAKRLDGQAAPSDTPTSPGASA